MSKNLPIETIERRYIDPVEVNFRAAEDKEMTVEGRPIVYGVRTIIFPGWAEVIEKGAATDALKENIAYLLWQHDRKMPMATYRNQTLAHSEDDNGVSITADCSMTAWGRDGYEAIKNKTITKMSFAFQVDEVEWEDVENEDGSILSVRHIVKLKHIYDFSPVTFPAYNDTEVFQRSLNEFKQNKNNGLFMADARSRRLRLSGF